GDYLSYYQDAVATEAYMGTARRRVSMRRHLRLIDYRLHEGCNARAWVTVQVKAPIELPYDDVRFITLQPGALPDAGAALRPDAERLVAPSSYEVFEPMGRQVISLSPYHNEIDLWTWGEDECCIPAGSTRATLKDQWIADPAAGNERGSKKR